MNSNENLNLLMDLPICPNLYHGFMLSKHICVKLAQYLKNFKLTYKNVTGLPML
jgi:hypothetical protein